MTSFTDCWWSWAELRRAQQSPQLRATGPVFADGDQAQTNKLRASLRQRRGRRIQPAVRPSMAGGGSATTVEGLICDDSQPNRART